MYLSTIIIRRLAPECVPDRRRRAVQFSLPTDLTSMKINVVKHPSMFIGRTFRSIFHTGVIQPFYRIRFGPGTNRGCKKYVITYDHRRAPRQSWNVGGPNDIFCLAPRFRQRRVVRDDSRRIDSKLRPSLLPGHSAATQRYKRGYQQPFGPIHWICLLIKFSL